MKCPKCKATLVKVDMRSCCSNLKFYYKCNNCSYNNDKIKKESPNATQTRWEKANAAYKIDGYFFHPTGGIPKTAEDAFNEAKKELTEHLQKELQNIEAMTLEEYTKWRKKGFNA